MSESGSLIDILKRVLRQHGVTYAMVAERLGLSKASIKRSFSEKHFTLQRLDAICQMVGIGVIDLVRQFDEEQHRISHLTYEQETELVSDLKLLLVAVCARNHWSFDEILQTYALTKPECIHYMVTLDRIGIIDLFPENRFKLRISEDFRWLPSGPIEEFYASHLQSEFLDTNFNQAGHRRLFLSGAISQTTQNMMIEKIDSLAKDFAIMQKQDQSLPLGERNSVSIILAMRPWEFSLFQEMTRKK